MDGPRKKNMIVEDEALSVLSLRMVLQNLGYKVVEAASSGEKALDIIRRERPDVVLMDVLLAGEMTGIETAIRMRQWHDAPVVFMTGYRDQETLEGLGRIERATCLFKPFAPEDIARAVSQALGEAGSV